MELIKIKDLEAIGLPGFDMRKIFNINKGENVEISFIKIMPGMRIPETGFSCHDKDEYSVIVGGEIFTSVEGEDFVISEGDATLIKKGEKHWCRNDKDVSCTLVCVMV